MSTQPGPATAASVTSPAAPPPSRDDAATPRRKLIAIAVCAVSVLVIGVLVGVTRNGSDDVDAAGTTLARPVTMPDITLPDTSGTPINLRERSDGQLTLLYFGYLNCPDACPVTLGVLARVMDSLPSDVRSAVEVWFVSTDPDRDTPERVAEFLAFYDASFVGLVATPRQVRDLQIAVDIPVATAEPGDADGNYLVGHATSVFAFELDGVARQVFPFGTRHSDWVRVLPDLVTGDRERA